MEMVEKDGFNMSPSMAEAMEEDEDEVGKHDHLTDDEVELIERVREQESPVHEEVMTMSKLVREVMSADCEVCKNKIN